VACLGALSAFRNDSKAAWQIEKLGALHTQAVEERRIIERFVEGLGGSPGPILVGFNTGGFDLSVLRYRAMALGIEAGPLHGTNKRNYWYRFGRDHVDLCDVLSNYGASTKPSLAEAGALIGISAKSGGIDGSRVEAYINTGRAQEVANYCETDVLSTYLLYLRWQLATGELDEKTHARSVDAVQGFIANKMSARPHLRPYADSGDQILLDPGGIAGENGADMGSQAVTVLNTAAPLIVPTLPTQPPVRVASFAQILQERDRIHPPPQTAAELVPSGGEAGFQRSNVTDPR
jgi:predicted PolB exonuclease-like 3'-5' exonuclease